MSRTARFAAAAIAVVVLVAAAWWLASRRERHPNLLLITIDTLRADHVGAYGATSGATPALDALAASGVRFDQVQTAVPLTGPSHATILTGQYPPSHGVRGNVVFTLGSKYPTLATMLKRQGYRTAAFVGAYPVAAAFGFNQGYDTFDEEFHETSPGESGAERRANEVADSALKWLESSANAASDRPFFAWLHFYDPHAPYAPPAPYKDRFSGHAYDGEIAFTDAQVGRVIDWLRASHHEADTVLVVLADHGEGLGDHEELMHALLVYQSTMRIPMVMSGPGIPKGMVVRPRVATIDVLPTVLGLLGMTGDSTLVGRDVRPLMTSADVSGDGLYGESLFGRLNCHWASLRTWVKDDWKLIVGSHPELYNLATDPEERRDVARDEAARVDRMTQELRRAMQRMAPQGDKAQPNPATPEQEQRLRSLGYTAGSAGSKPLDDPRLPDPRTHVQLYDRLQAATAAQGPALARAFEDVQEVTRLDPDNPFAFGTLASMAYRFGSLPMAQRAFERTLELDPDRPGIRQNYGKLLRELGHVEESERELRIALVQTTEDDTRTRTNLAETLIARGKTSEADAMLQSVLAREPKNPEALGAKGRLLLAQNRIPEALTALQQATATAEPEPFIELAAAYLRANRVSDGRTAATEALRRSPGHPWAIAVLAHALILEGQRSQGLEYLQRAVAIRPRRPAVWEALAAAFDAAGQPGDAARCRGEARALITASK